MRRFKGILVPNEKGAGLKARKEESPEELIMLEIQDAKFCEAKGKVNYD